MLKASRIEELLILFEFPAFGLIYHFGVPFKKHLKVIPFFFMRNREKMKQCLMLVGGLLFHSNLKFEFA